MINIDVNDRKYLDFLYMCIENDLSVKEKIKIFKETLLNLKNTWIETRQYGKEISPLLTLKGLKNYFQNIWYE